MDSLVHSLRHTGATSPVAFLRLVHAVPLLLSLYLHHTLVTLFTPHPLPLHVHYYMAESVT